MMDWLEIAKTLPLSSKTRSNCECGDGKPAVINHQLKGYSFYCFRCDTKFFEHKGQQTLAELARIKELNELATQSFKIELPKDFTEEIPLVGRLWLYKAGITPTVWKKYGFGWSEFWQRVVMPVYEGDKLVWFQARAVLDGQKPKYINPTGDRESLMFLAATTNDRSEIILVEDILSAVRVGAVAPACSMLGTKITTAQAGKLAQYDIVRTWFDNDRAGKQGAYNVRRCIGLGTEVLNIRSTQDPKSYSNTEIREILNDGICRQLKEQQLATQR